MYIILYHIVHCRGDPFCRVSLLIYLFCRYLITAEWRKIKMERVLNKQLGLSAERHTAEHSASLRGSRSTAMKSTKDVHSSSGKESISATGRSSSGKESISAAGRSSSGKESISATGRSSSSKESISAAGRSSSGKDSITVADRPPLQGRDELLGIEQQLKSNLSKCQYPCTTSHVSDPDGIMDTGEEFGGLAAGTNRLAELLPPAVHTVSLSSD